MFCFPCSEDKDLVYKDAVFFSMHKFVGGVDSPGKYTCVVYQALLLLIVVLQVF